MSGSFRPLSVRVGRKAMGCLVLAVVAAGLFFYQLDEKDIWERPEGRSALIARKMVASSQFLVPELFDRPFLDNRPPGYYWLVAAAFRLTGVESEYVARLPGALAGLACVLAVYGFGCRLVGTRCGFWAGIVLLGMVKFTWQARVAEQDMVLALWTCLGYWTFWQWLQAIGTAAPGRRHRGWLVLFQVFVGFGAMTKGPAIVLTLVLPLLLYLLLSGRWREVHWRAVAATCPVALTLALWWYVYVWFAVPAEQGQLVARFLHQGRFHVRHVGYYLVKMPALLGPVTLLLPMLWWSWHSAGSDNRRGYLGYVLSWFLGTVAVFSLPASKQTHYLVPCLPALALALGAALAQRLPQARTLEQWFVALIIGCLALSPALWIFLAPANVGLHDSTLEWCALAVGCGMASVLGWCLWAGRSALAFRCAWACWLVALGLVLGEVVPRFDALESPRGFANRIDQALPYGARLAVVSDHPGIACYLNEPVVVLDDARKAREFLEVSREHYLVVESDELAREFKDFQRAGTVVVLKQDGFMKRRVCAYLLRDPD
jgi:4-amino-4-deoxy-L-arabinose transferase-like glycosyltransferase